MDLKSILKTLKLNESNISMILGIVVVLLVGFFAINYFRSKNAGYLTTAVNTESKNTPSVGKTYTVEKGDSLWKIAETAYGSGYNWTDIASENKLVKADMIEVGQVLSIPDVQPKTLTAEGQKAVLTGDSAIPGTTYTVVKGDSLWQIAVRAYGDGYKWVSIARENNLKNPNIIHSGNVLTLPR